MLEFGDLNNWLENWIATASEDELRSKFKDVMPYLAEEDIAYLFYSLITKEYPEEEVDELFQIMKHNTH
ncbi:MAG: hypothetical protein KME30_26210 [Iphinoe sp. HA4291-MV1]|jgi:hypothetical protein|nr:hypothetical protein [Iphinoe sp. HA4291-MV1]